MKSRFLVLGMPLTLIAGANLNGQLLDSPRHDLEYLTWGLSKQQVASHFKKNVDDLKTLQLKGKAAKALSSFQVIVPDFSLKNERAVFFASFLKTDSTLFAVTIMIYGGGIMGTVSSDFIDQLWNEYLERFSAVKPDRMLDSSGCYTRVWTLEKSVVSVSRFTSPVDYLMIAYAARPGARRERGE